jgi:hypothetical protein
VESPEAYFREVENAVRSKPDWKVHRTAALGFFNFARYRLWLDLDSRQWPQGSAPADHPMVQDLVDQKWRGDVGPLPPKAKSPRTRKNMICRLFWKPMEHSMPR